MHSKWIHSTLLAILLSNLFAHRYYLKCQSKSWFYKNSLNFCCSQKWNTANHVKQRKITTKRLNYISLSWWKYLACKNSKLLTKDVFMKYNFITLIGSSTFWPINNSQFLISFTVIILTAVLGFLVEPMFT